jgi:hypothetical protein
VQFRPGVRGFYAFAEAVALPLEPFARRIVRAMLGEQHEALVLLPRGNGKSTLVGALAAHHLLTEPKAAVYLAAASRDRGARRVRVCARLRAAPESRPIERNRAFPRERFSTQMG